MDASETPIERPKKRVRNKKRVKNRGNKQKYFYSGKKKRHTLKSQIVVEKKQKKSFVRPLAMARNMIFDFLRRVGYDGQKIVMESLTVDIQVYRNFKTIQNYQKNRVRKSH